MGERKQAWFERKYLDDVTVHSFGPVTDPPDTDPELCQHPDVRQRTSNGFMGTIYESLCPDCSAFSWSVHGYPKLPPARMT